MKATTKVSEATKTTEAGTEITNSSVPASVPASVPSSPPSATVMTTRVEFRLLTTFGFPGYIISNTGNIYRGGSIEPIALETDEQGYKIVAFPLLDDEVYYYVHNLVALTFLPMPADLGEVSHLDGNKGNNDVLNLQYLINKNKAKQYHRKKRNMDTYGMRTRNRKVKKLTVDGQLVAILPSIGAAAMNCYDSRDRIKNACRDKRIINGYRWEYLEDKPKTEETSESSDT